MNTRRAGGMLKTALAAAMAVLLAGCFGKPPPVEQYLAVHPLAGSPCAGNIAAQTGKLVVAVKGFKVVDAVNRQAVLVGRGLVQSPSLAWYWEAAPQQLVGQAVVGKLACSKALAPVWPVRSATRADRVLTGQVTDFWVDEVAKTLHAGVRVQLWDARESAVLAGRDFTVSTPVAAFDAQGVAEAATAALETLGAEVTAWTEQNAGTK